MGSVWLARRSDGRYEGQAAVKLLNLGALGSGGAERLRLEANALAKLSHRNITHLIDAGVSAGQPYIVLEYVEGEPIDIWCDARGSRCRRSRAAVPAGARRRVARPWPTHPASGSEAFEHPRHAGWQREAAGLRHCEAARRRWTNDCAERDDASRRGRDDSRICRARAVAARGSHDRHGCLRAGRAALCAAGRQAPDCERRHHADRADAGAGRGRAGTSERSGYGKPTANCSRRTACRPCNSRGRYVATSTTSSPRRCRSCPPIATRPPTPSPAISSAISTTSRSARVPSRARIECGSSFAGIDSQSGAVASIVLVLVAGIAGTTWQAIEAVASGRKQRRRHSKVRVNETSRVFRRSAPRPPASS